MSTGSIGHQLLMGIEYSSERPTFRQLDIPAGGIAPINALTPVYALPPGATPPLAFTFFSRNEVDGFAAYAQDQIAITDALNIVAGIRHSVFDYETDRNGVGTRNTISNTSWQVGGTLALGGGLSLFGGYNTGFDLEPVVGARSRDESPFQPETSNQAEAGVRLVRGTARASLSAFQITRSNVAVTDPLDPNFQIQEGQLRVKGVEIEGEWSPVPGWWLQGGYAYLDGRVTRTTTAALQDARLGDTPEHTATASTRVMLGPIELRGLAYYVGKRKLVNGSPVTLDDYAVFDLGVGTEIGRLRLDATLTNVADTVYYTANGGAAFVYPGDPRTFSLRVGYRFGGARP